MDNHKDRFAGVGKKTAWFVIGAGALLLLVLGMAAIKQDYFRETTTLYFFAPHAQGLNKGMAVNLIGFKVGSVEEITMEPNATVKVRLSLGSQHVRLIGQDAKARLIKEALVGASVVEIVPGSTQSPRVAQNGVLLFERGRDVGELAESLVDQIQPILADIKNITGAVSEADADLGQSIRNVRVVSDELIGTTRRINELADNGNATLATANHALKTVDESLPQLLLKLDASLENVKNITDESAERIPGIMRNGDLLVKDSQEIVSAAKKSWPIRYIIEQPEEQMLPLDGYAAPAPKEGKP